MADIRSIVGEVADGLKQGAGQVGAEFKKMGQTATSQVTGSNTGSSGDSSKIAEAMNKMDTGQTPSDDYSIWGEFKQLGQSATKQVSGDTGGNPDEAELSSMTKKDKDFSKTEYSNVRAKVMQIYREYEEKKKKEEMKRKQGEEVEEEQEKETDELKQEKKKEALVNPAIQKARAENKNYGAE